MPIHPIQRRHPLSILGGAIASPPLPMVHCQQISAFSYVESKVVTVFAQLQLLMATTAASIIGGTRQRHQLTLHILAFLLGSLPDDYPFLPKQFCANCQFNAIFFADILIVAKFDILCYWPTWLRVLQLVQTSGSVSSFALVCLIFSTCLQYYSRTMSRPPGLQVRTIRCILKTSDWGLFGFWYAFNLPCIVDCQGE